MLKETELLSLDLIQPSQRVSVPHTTSPQPNMKKTNWKEQISAQYRDQDQPWLNCEYCLFIAICHLIL